MEEEDLVVIETADSASAAIETQVGELETGGLEDTEECIEEGLEVNGVMVEDGNETEEMQQECMEDLHNGIGHAGITLGLSGPTDHLVGSVTELAQPPLISQPATLPNGQQVILLSHATEHPCLAGVFESTYCIPLSVMSKP